MFFFIRKYCVLTLVLVLFFSVRSIACDICGCGLGNYYIGIIPQFNKTFFGVRYQYNSFHTQLASDKTQYSNDYFRTVELWGGMNIGKKWQVLAFVPMSYNKQVSDEGITKKNGMGDVAALVNYSVFEKSSLNRDSTKMIFQQLWIGGGIKAPTGESRIDPAADEIIAAANSQLGTGSTDFMLNAAYNLHIGNWGVSSNVNYKINTANKEEYKFGNKFTSNDFLFYTIKKNKVTISPNIGISYENSGLSLLKKQPVAQTGGNATFTIAGVEAGIGKVNIGFNVQDPLVQNYASGQTKYNMKAMAHVTFSL